MLYNITLKYNQVLYQAERLTKLNKFGKTFSSVQAQYSKVIRKVITSGIRQISCIYLLMTEIT